MWLVVIYIVITCDLYCDYLWFILWLVVIYIVISCDLYCDCLWFILWFVVVWIVIGCFLYCDWLLFVMWLDVPACLLWCNPHLKDRTRSQSNSQRTWSDWCRTPPLRGTRPASPASQPWQTLSWPRRTFWPAAKRRWSAWGGCLMWAASRPENILNNQTIANKQNRY